MQPIFNNTQIKSSILQGMQEAKYAIELAVAWFTDTDLFSELLEACSRGVKVCVLLNDDDTNRTSRIDWDALVAKGGALYWYFPQSGIMHQKFCVVDGQTSYYGTYNWTFAAANRNIESVLILTDPSVADYFRAILKNLLENPNSIPHSGTSTYFLQSSLIGHPEMEMLRLEIAALEMLLAELEEKVAHTESLLSQYEATLKRELADLLLEQLRTNELLAKAKAKLTRKRVYEEEANEWQSKYKQTEESLTEANTRKAPLEAHVRAEMARMYKQAIRLIHPDRYANDPEKYAIATQITQELISAYKAEDRERIEELCRNIQSGWVFGLDVLKSDDIEMLRAYLQKLKRRQGELLGRLEDLNRDETLVAAERYPVFSEYVEICRQQLSRNIELLKKEIQHIENE